MPVLLLLPRRSRFGVGRFSTPSGPALSCTARMPPAPNGLGVIRRLLVLSNCPSRPHLAVCPPRTRLDARTHALDALNMLPAVLRHSFVESNRCFTERHRQGRSSAPRLCCTGDDAGTRRPEASSRRQAALERSEKPFQRPKTCLVQLGPPTAPSSLWGQQRDLLGGHDPVKASRDLRGRLDHHQNRPSASELSSMGKKGLLGPSTAASAS